MAGESKGTEVASLGAERGDGDHRRRRETVAARPGSGEAIGRG
jgi:hypothetical protein